MTFAPATFFNDALNRDAMEEIQYMFEVKKVNVSDEVEGRKQFIHAACLKDKLPVVKYLVEEQGVDPNVKDKWWEETCLHHAVLSKAHAVTDYMINIKKVNLNTVDSRNETALIKAAWAGNIVAVKKLVENGADLKLIDKTKRTALDWAKARGKVLSIEYLESVPQDNNDQEDLSDGIFNEEIEVRRALEDQSLGRLKWLIEEKNVNPNKKYNGKSLLHFSAQYKLTEFVRYLIEEKHADPNIRGARENQPVHEAAFYGALPIVRYLIERRKVDINSLNKNKETPLYKAVTNNQTAVVKYLVERGADTKVLTLNLRNALHAAEVRKNKDVIKLLKTKPNKKSKRMKREIEFDSSNFLVEQPERILKQIETNDHENPTAKALDSPPITQDLNSTLLALSVLLSKLTGIKLFESPSEIVTQKSELELQATSLNILDNFEKILVGEGCLADDNLDPTELISAIKSHLRKANFEAISNLLIDYSLEVCPQFEKDQNVLKRVAIEIKDYLSKEIMPMTATQLLSATKKPVDQIKIMPQNAKLQIDTHVYRLN